MTARQPGKGNRQSIMSIKQNFYNYPIIGNNFINGNYIYNSSLDTWNEYGYAIFENLNNKSYKFGSIRIITKNNNNKFDQDSGYCKFEIFGKNEQNLWISLDKFKVGKPDGSLDYADITDVPNLTHKKIIFLTRNFENNKFYYSYLIKNIENTENFNFPIIEIEWDDNTTTNTNTAYTFSETNTSFQIGSRDNIRYITNSNTRELDTVQELGSLIKLKLHKTLDNRAVILPPVSTITYKLDNTVEAIDIGFEIDNSTNETTLRLPLHNASSSATLNISTPNLDLDPYNPKWNNYPIKPPFMNYPELVLQSENWYAFPRGGTLVSPTKLPIGRSESEKNKEVELHMKFDKAIPSEDIFKISGEFYKKDKITGNWGDLVQKADCNIIPDQNDPNQNDTVCLKFILDEDVDYFGYFIFKLGDYYRYQRWELNNLTDIYTYPEGNQGLPQYLFINQQPEDILTFFVKLNDVGILGEIESITADEGLIINSYTYNDNILTIKFSSSDTPRDIKFTIKIKKKNDLNNIIYDIPYSISPLQQINPSSIMSNANTQSNNKKLEYWTSMYNLRRGLFSNDLNANGLVASINLPLNGDIYWNTNQADKGIVLQYSHEAFPYNSNKWDNPMAYGTWVWRETEKKSFVTLNFFTTDDSDDKDNAKFQLWATNELILYGDELSTHERFKATQHPHGDNSYSNSGNDFNGWTFIGDFEFKKDKNHYSYGAHTILKSDTLGRREPSISKEEWISQMSNEKFGIWMIYRPNTDYYRGNVNTQTAFFTPRLSRIAINTDADDSFWIKGDIIDTPGDNEKISNKYKSRINITPSYFNPPRTFPTFKNKLEFDHQFFEGFTINNDNSNITQGGNALSGTFSKHEWTGRELSATTGVLTGSMQIQGEFITVPNGTELPGKAAFTVRATTETNVVLQCEVRTPNYEDDSFYIWFDDAERHEWHTTIRTSFGWVTVTHQDTGLNKSFLLTPGVHTLYVGSREDGAEMRTLRILSGDAVFETRDDSVIIVDNLSITSTDQVTITIAIDKADDSRSFQVYIPPFDIEELSFNPVITNSATTGNYLLQYSPNFVRTNAVDIEHTVFSNFSSENIVTNIMQNGQSIVSDQLVLNGDKLQITNLILNNTFDVTFNIQLQPKPNNETLYNPFSFDLVILSSDIEEILFNPTINNPEIDNDNFSNTKLLYGNNFENTLITQLEPVGNSVFAESDRIKVTLREGDVDPDPQVFDNLIIDSEKNITFGPIVLTRTSDDSVLLKYEYGGKSYDWTIPSSQIKPATDIVTNIDPPTPSNTALNALLVNQSTKLNIVVPPVYIDNTSTVDSTIDSISVKVVNTITNLNLSDLSIDNATRTISLNYKALSKNSHTFIISFKDISLKKIYYKISDDKIDNFSFPNTIGNITRFPLSITYGDTVEITIPFLPEIIPGIIGSIDNIVETSFVITDKDTVSKNGISFNPDLSGDWNIFTIASVHKDTYLNTEYVIDWENTDNSHIHGGYFTKKMGVELSDNIIRGTGPVWWWYPGPASYAPTGWLPGDESENPDRRKFTRDDIAPHNTYHLRHKMKIQFTDNEMIIKDNITGDWLESRLSMDDNSIYFGTNDEFELMYKMFNTNGIVTGPHNFTVKHNIIPSSNFISGNNFICNLVVNDDNFYKEGAITLQYPTHYDNLESEPYNIMNLLPIINNPEIDNTNTSFTNTKLLFGNNFENTLCLEDKSIFLDDEEDEVDVTVNEGDYKILEFKTSETSTVTSIDLETVSILVVGGGGAGGIYNGGYDPLPNGEPDNSGGGAGGLIYLPSWDLNGYSTLEIKIGNGGNFAAKADTSGGNGENTTVTATGNGVTPKTLIAYGGGRGGFHTHAGADGGSGGGGWGYSTTLHPGNTIQPLDTNDLVYNYPGTGFGNDGGVGVAGSGAGAGGGGAGGKGYDHNEGKHGGLGHDFGHIFGSNYGTNGWFASGGAGISNYNTPESVTININRDKGGGGHAYIYNKANPEPLPYNDNANGMANTGGGGGSGGYGGSGIVLIRYINKKKFTPTISNGKITFGPFTLGDNSPLPIEYTYKTIKYNWTIPSDQIKPAPETPLVKNATDYIGPVLKYNSNGQVIDNTVLMKHSIFAEFITQTSESTIYLKAYATGLTVSATGTSDNAVQTTIIPPNTLEISRIRTNGNEPVILTVSDSDGNQVITHTITQADMYDVRPPYSSLRDALPVTLEEAEALKALMATKNISWGSINPLNTTNSGVPPGLYHDTTMDQLFFNSAGTDDDKKLQSNPIWSPVRIRPDLIALLGETPVSWDITSGSGYNVDGGTWTKNVSGTKSNYIYLTGDFDFYLDVSQSYYDSQFHVGLFYLANGEVPISDLNTINWNNNLPSLIPILNSMNPNYRYISSSYGVGSASYIRWTRMGANILKKNLYSDFSIQHDLIYGPDGSSEFFYGGGFTSKTNDANRGLTESTPIVLVTTLGSNSTLVNAKIGKPRSLPPSWGITTGNGYDTYGSGHGTWNRYASDTGVGNYICLEGDFDITINCRTPNNKFSFTILMNIDSPITSADLKTHWSFDAAQWEGSTSWEQFPAHTWNADYRYQHYGFGPGGSWDPALITAKRVGGTFLTEGFKADGTLIWKHIRGPGTVTPWRWSGFLKGGGANYGDTPTDADSEPKIWGESTQPLILGILVNPGSESRMTISGMLKNIEIVKE